MKAIPVNARDLDWYQDEIVEESIDGGSCHLVSVTADCNGRELIGTAYGIGFPEVDVEIDWATLCDVEWSD